MKRRVCRKNHGVKSCVPVRVVVMLTSPMFGMLFVRANVIASHVFVIVVSPRDLSRTTSGEVAFWVQTTGPPIVLMVHVLSALPSSDPKKRDPDGFVNGERIEEKSEAPTSPKTAISSVGIEWRD